MKRNVFLIVMICFLLEGCSSSKKLAPVIFKGDKAQEAPRPLKISSLYPKEEQVSVPLVEEIDVTQSLLSSQDLNRSPLYHLVKRGETVLSIANLYKVDLPMLIHLNQFQSPYTLFEGQRIQIPQSMTSASQLPGNVTIQQKPFQDSLESSSHQPSFLTKPTEQLPLVAQDKKEEKVSIIPTIPPLENPILEPTIESQKPEIQGKSFSGPLAVLPTPDPLPTKDKIFSLPVTGETLVEFGLQSNGSQNDGINIAAPQGAPVRAAEKGTVTYAGNELQGFGNLVLIKHDNGWMSAYGHLGKITASRGQSVQKGQQIGTVGKTGSVTSPQVHFELRHGGICVNPKDYVS